MAKKSTKLHNLTKKQHEFAQQYIIDLNATQAAIRAGYSKKSAKVIGHQLLNLPLLSKYIQRLKDERQERTRITQDEVVKIYADIVRFDIAKIFNNDGAMKDIHEIDAETRVAIAGVESEDVFDGVGQSRKHVGYLRKIKTADKRAACHDLMLHFGGFKKDNEQKSAAEKAAALSLLVAASSTEERAAIVKSILQS